MIACSWQLAVDLTYCAHWTWCTCTETRWRHVFNIHMYLILCIWSVQYIEYIQFTFSTYSIRKLGFVVWNYFWLRCVDVIWCVIKCRRQKWRRGVKHILWCSVLIPGFLGDKEASQSWSSVSGFRVEGRPPDHKTVMLTTTANSCNNCIETFQTSLAENEFPLSETGEILFYNNPDKLLCVGGANDTKSSPHDCWSRTKSRRCFSDNNITVAATVFFYRYSWNISIQMQLCPINAIRKVL